jgi:hypothetical protein
MNWLLMKTSEPRLVALELKECFYYMAVMCLERHLEKRSEKGSVTQKGLERDLRS